MIKSSIEDIEIKQTKKILRVLGRAKTPVPLGYISLHTGIEEPLEILESRPNGKNTLTYSSVYFLGGEEKCVV